MNLHHLAIFEAVARCNSVSVASKELHISQPAVSHQVHELEGRLGVELFDRLPREMRLTEAGELLYEYSKRIFKLEHSAENAVKDYVELGSGQLDVGASQTIGCYLLPRVLARFRREHPRVYVRLMIENTARVARGVEDYSYALGFVEGPLPDGDFAVTPLRDDRIVPVVAGSHPLAKNPPATMQELASQPTLLREAGSGSRRTIEDAFAENELELECAGEIGNSESLMRAAMSGAGVVWLSELGIMDELSRGTLCELPTHGLKINRSLNLIRLSGRYLNPGAAALLAHCVEYERDAATVES